MIKKGLYYIVHYCLYTPLVLIIKGVKAYIDYIYYSLVDADAEEIESDFCIDHAEEKESYSSIEDYLSANESAYYTRDRKKIEVGDVIENYSRLYVIDSITSIGCSAIELTIDNGKIKRGKQYTLTRDKLKKSAFVDTM